MRDPKVTAAVERLYDRFGAYPRPQAPNFCAECYDPREIAYFHQTPLREFSPEMARSLVWEAHDHWQDTAIYKHYLPMILDVLAPPRRCVDMHDDHLFDTLRALGFADWPAAERDAFWQYVVAVHDALQKADETEAQEWKSAATKLSGAPYPQETV